MLQVNRSINLAIMKFSFSKKRDFTSFNADILGLCSSILCLLHCLFLPLFLILQPVLFSFVEEWQANEWWEYLDFVFLLISCLALVLAIKRVSKKRKILFFLAYVIFAFGILLGEKWIILSYIGSVGLAVLHLKNYQEHKHCKI